MFYFNICEVNYTNVVGKSCECNFIAFILCFYVTYGKLKEYKM